jgi:DNA polymerase delta subunit 4
MPPKRKTTRSATQSTLAFHGSANKVTKSGAKTARAKNIVDEPTAKPSKPEKVKLEVTEETEPTDGDSSLVPEPEKSVAVPPAPSTPEEDAARKITDKQIKAYWKKKEDQRNAPRVHQEKLSLHEKILIEFDMSGHYGVSAFLHSQPGPQC